MNYMPARDSLFIFTRYITEFYSDNYNFKKLIYLIFITERSLPMTQENNSYETATGPIDYGFRNDYMFRATLQKSMKTLKGLVGSMLHINPDDIQSVEITNPIILGESIDIKDFILDINVLLNNNTIINLEMQVNNLFDWTERSLSYLCRSFDQLNKGQPYAETKPVIHIGFLD